MGQANCCCGSREALSDTEPVLSADVRLTRGRKRSERRLLLLQEELLIAKLQRGSTLRPQLRLALDQLWVLSKGKEAAHKEEENSDEDLACLIFIWPGGSCVAHFGSQALKDLWLDALLGTTEEAKRPRVTYLASLKVVEKELSCRRAGRTFNTRSLERLMEYQGDAKEGPLPAPSGNGGGLGHRAAGGSSSSSRRRGLPWPFALRRSPAVAQAPGQEGSGCSRALFGQPLAALCGEDGTLPQPIQELLTVLRREGPSTEGIFRRATSGTALRELREALDRGLDVDIGSQPADLLAVILKDFLRNIPSKLLMEDLYEEWMAAMERSSMEEKMEEMKVVAKKLPAANLLLLKELLSVLQHIGHNAATSRMTFNNLAICVGPNLLSPPKEELLPLDALLEVTQKVNVLVEFMIKSYGDIFVEELTGPSAKESPAHMDRSADLHLEEQSGRTDENHQVPLSSTAITSQSSAESLEKLEKLRSPSEERRFAGSPKDKEKERKRKRTEVWGEEDDSQMEKKRKKTGNVSGDGARKRHRKVQRFRKPRSRFPVSS